MRNVTRFLLAATLSSAAFAAMASDPTCTTEDSSKWKDKEQFQQDLKAQGYEIKKFKVTSTNCYELYGKNAEGQKVEIYFNPVDGSVVKQEIDD